MEIVYNSATCALENRASGMCEPTPTPIPTSLAPSYCLQHVHPLTLSSTVCTPPVLALTTLDQVLKHLRDNYDKEEKGSRQENLRGPPEAIGVYRCQDDWQCDSGPV